MSIESFSSMAELLQALKQFHKNKVLDPRFALNSEGKLTLKAPTGLSELFDADGGYLVGGEVVAPIVRSIAQKSNIFRKATKFYSQSLGSNAAWIPFVEETARSNAAFQLKTYWPAEGGSKTAAKYVFGLDQCKLNKVYALMYVTDELWSDSLMLQQAIEQFVASPVDGSLVWQIERAMLYGAGGSSMSGVFTTGQGTIQVATADPLNEASILNFVKALAPASQATSEWYMSKEKFNEVLDINSWNSDDAVKYEAGRMILFGLPVNVMEQMYGGGKIQGDIVLGDFSQYGVALKAGPLVQSAVSIHVKFLSDEKTVRWGIRINGKSFGSQYSLEDGTAVGSFVIPNYSPIMESSSSVSSLSSLSSQSSMGHSQSSLSSMGKSSQSSLGHSSSLSSPSSLGKSSASSPSSLGKSSASSPSSQSSLDITSLSSQSSLDITSQSSLDITSLSSQSSLDKTSESSQSLSSQTYSSAEVCDNNYCVSGAGTAALNGTYTFVGDYVSGKPVYQKADASKFIWYDITYTRWVLGNDAGDPPGQWLSSQDNGGALCPDDDTWVDEVLTVATGAC